MLGTCLTAIPAEPQRIAEPKNPLVGEKLLAIRGLPLTHKMVGEVMNSLGFKKVRTVRDEAHRTEIDGVVRTHSVGITTYFVAADKTVEIVVMEKQAEDPTLNRRPYVELIRIGLPQAGEAYLFVVPQADGLTRSQAEAYLQTQKLKAEPLFPFGITISMTPEQIHQLCDRPYAIGLDAISKGGSGSIKFFEDPDSPLPITVWFEKGLVCGVDIHTWGTRSENEDSEQAVPSDGHKPSSRVPSDGPTAPADAH